jgi:hypothetical protein
MFTNSKISGISSKFTSTFSGLAKIARSRTVLAAAVAAASLGVAGSGFGAVADINSITTSDTYGATSTVSNVSGYGASYSVYQPKDVYNLKYLGEDDAITSVNAGSLGVYNVSGQANTVVQRGTTGGDNDMIWEVGTGNGSNHSTVTMAGPVESSLQQALDGNNVLVGGDNVFSNMGNAVGNNTNVDRIDVLFTGGLKTSASKAFAVFDRGPTTDHDAFEIAAITSIDKTTGLPASYGPLYTFADGKWGTPAIIPPGMSQENILRKNDTVKNDPFHPSDVTIQDVGGVLIPSNYLDPTGSTIYGYSLFSGAVKAGTTSAQLVDWTDLPAANSTSTGGGLDPLDTLGALYTQQVAVPEPTTAAMAALAIGGFIVRRPKRKLV